MSTIGYLRDLREWASPTLKNSAFLNKGQLTPEEFVQAGDELVFRCPTWSWESGDPAKLKPHLPPNKQYLITRSVPCQQRVASMETGMEMLSTGDDDADVGDWLISNVIRNDAAADAKNTSSNDDGNDHDSIEDDFDLVDADGEIMEKPAATTPTSAAATAGDAKDDDDDDEFADMEDYFQDDTLIQDDAAASSSPQDDTNQLLVKVRTYDLSITYDKYYNTPRVWMVGKSTQGQPLTGQQMMEDVISDYANRTVTIENHPHVSGPHASIHPCKHGAVMKAIVRNLVSKDTIQGEGEEEKLPTVEMYLFIFLKFVSSMIPTINYDFTMDVTADTSK
uniref:Autophagy-related protein 3 n=1 Tax=Craspedostauros australis TaxID=1486917 RepID=A0A7R9ZK15_9STRA